MRNQGGAALALLLRLFLVTASGATSATAVAQRNVPGEEPKDWPEMTLEELLNVPITVATKNPSSVRATPGIVTLITRDEIVNMGARDLMDVLRMVPGFDFGVDTQGAVGIGARGNWGHEGKILLLVDGLEFNEILYSTLQFGRHFLVDTIQRIEIVRGPGSVIYGGYAELAVINVITRTGEELNGGFLQTTLSQMDKSYGQRSVSTAFGQRLSNGAYSVATTFSRGNRSDGVFTDFYDNSLDMTDNSELNLFNLNFGMTYKGLGVRLIVDQYHTTEGDVYTVAAPLGLMNDFNTWLLAATYDIEVAENLKLTPRFSYSSFNPWRSDDETARTLEEEFPDQYGGNLANRKAERFVGNVTAVYDPSPKVNVLAGLEAYTEQARDRLPQGTFLTGDNERHFSNGALFAQTLIKTSVADIAIGVRADHHSEFGSAFVPRLGLTRIFNRFHAKALASQAFRAPGIMNIDLNPDIKPEKTTVLEFEVGYQLSDSMFLTANVFDILIRDPILYTYDAEDPVFPEKYLNYTKAGTRGLEIEHRLDMDGLYVNTTYSFYTASHNEVSAYAVPIDDDLTLAFPAHKLTANGHFRVSKHISVNPSLVYLSERYGFDGLDETEENPTNARFDPMMLVNLNVIFPDVLGSGMSLSAGILDLLDARYSFIQPYRDGWKAPLPDRGRELVFRIGYSF